MSTEVTRVDGQSRYEITVDGALAGFAEYRERSGRVIFSHTEIDPEFEGQGLGSRLAQDALADAVGRNQVIVPACPFIARYLERHPFPDARIETP